MESIWQSVGRGRSETKKHALKSRKPKEFVRARSVREWLPIVESTSESLHGRLSWPCQPEVPDSKQTPKTFIAPDWNEWKLLKDLECRFGANFPRKAKRQQRHYRNLQSRLMLGGQILMHKNCFYRFSGGERMHGVILVRPCHSRWPHSRDRGAAAWTTKMLSERRSYKKHKKEEQTSGTKGARIMPAVGKNFSRPLIQSYRVSSHWQGSLGHCGWPAKGADSVQSLSCKAEISVQCGTNRSPWFFQNHAGLLAVSVASAINVQLLSTAGIATKNC